MSARLDDDRLGTDGTHSADVADGTDGTGSAGGEDDWQMNGAERCTIQEPRGGDEDQNVDRVDTATG